MIIPRSAVEMSWLRGRYISYLMKREAVTPQGEDSLWTNPLLDRAMSLEACMMCDGDGEIYRQGEMTCPACGGAGFIPPVGVEK